MKSRIFKSEKQCVRAIFKLQEQFGGEILHYSFTCKQPVMGLSIDGNSILITQDEYPNGKDWFLTVPWFGTERSDEILTYLSTLEVSSLPKYDAIYMI